MQNFPLISADMVKQALDVEIHWVTEHGQDGVLTAGATVKATVSGLKHGFQWYHLQCADHSSMTSSRAPHWTSL